MAGTQEQNLGTLIFEAPTPEKIKEGTKAWYNLFRNLLARIERSQSVPIELIKVIHELKKNSPIYAD